MRSCIGRVGSVCVMLGVIACGAPFRDKFAKPIEGTLEVQSLGAPARPPEVYRIQQGDSLAVKFYRNPELNLDVIVRPDGQISLPLIDDVPAAGLSPQALGEMLERRYKGELAEPDVTVIVTAFGARRVFVGGEVDKPAELELVPGLTVLSSIMKAGGFKNSARKEQVILIRKGDDGIPRGTSLDLTEVVGGVHPERDVALQPYDVVVVPKSTVGDMNVFVELYITRNLPAGGVWLNFLAF